MKPRRPGIARLIAAARNLFAPSGYLARRPYAVAASLTLAASYGLTLRLLFGSAEVGDGAFDLASLVLVLLLRFGLLPLLSSRRAADAALDPWISLLALIPLLDLCLVIALSAAPSQHTDPAEGRAYRRPLTRRRLWIAVALGVAMSVGAVAFGTLLVGHYRTGLFLHMPFLIGATTGYFVNVGGDIGLSPTLRTQALLMVIAGMALIGAALEGVVCLVMALPLTLPMALLGAVLGRSIALSIHRRTLNAIGAPLLLLGILLAEDVVPGGGTFVERHGIEIDAPPAIVWSVLVDMPPIEEPPALPFRLGVAYTTGGHLTGGGVGALGIGAFSTGSAVVRVTAWEPGRELAFELLRAPPSMVELSVYENVRTPHLQGFFETRASHLRLVPLGTKRTRLLERTEHRLEIEPLQYWLPLARWIVRLNNERVLRHVKRQAETLAAS
ncbi:MAG TPA: SRPBCC family protein [Pseudomonadales bacterium]